MLQNWIGNVRLYDLRWYDISFFLLLFYVYLPEDRIDRLHVHSIGFSFVHSCNMCHDNVPDEKREETTGE